MEYAENVDYKELLLEDQYQYEKECEELGYHVDDLAEFPSALIDMRLNEVYVFDSAVEALGIKEGDQALCLL